jgi:hypothetical protein
LPHWLFLSGVGAGFGRLKALILKPSLSLSVFADLVDTHPTHFARLLKGAHMSHPGSAPCPTGFAPGEGGPPSIVVVEIISINPNTDLEGDDDYVPFYDNHADIYGFVTIDGETFNLPDIADDDFPH